MTRCPKCDEWMFRPESHRCFPFEAATPWRGKVDESSWEALHASNAEDAAAKYAERSDVEGDYAIIRNGEGEVWIRDQTGVITKWIIQAESVPEYSAHEKQEPLIAEERSK